VRKQFFTKIEFSHSKGVLSIGILRIGQSRQGTKEKCVAFFFASGLCAFVATVFHSFAAKKMLLIVIIKELNFFMCASA